VARRRAPAITGLLGGLLAGLLAVPACTDTAVPEQSTPGRTASATGSVAAPSVVTTSTEEATPPSSVTTALAPGSAPGSAPGPAPGSAPGPAPGPFRADRVPTCGENQGRTTRTTFPSQVFAPSAKPEQPYVVHTPPCYDAEPNRRYPVVYLLHGAQTDETQWMAVGALDAADRLTVAGEIPPVILVLPDALHAMGDYDGATPPLDWFVLHELVPRVEQAYRTGITADQRAIGGISRGGEWALLIAGRHPDVFGAVGGHSPAVGVPTNPGPELAARFDAAPVRIWLDVGAADSLAGPVGALDHALTARGIAHEARVGPGGHDRDYWRANVEDYLRWYTEPWREAA
jgi:enterochelin esterase-like enzyme